jgi:hypothetical protein
LKDPPLIDAVFVPLPRNSESAIRKGTPNKTTTTVKEAILELGERAGGESGLVG